jgi:dTMP kinase
VHKPIVVFEGLDGCGKTTVSSLVVEQLERQGLRVLRLREPGSTSLGEELRRLLLSVDVVVSPLTTALLFMAARSQLLQELWDRRDQYDLVVLDRFWFSTIAYQVYGQGVSLTAVTQMVDLLEDAYDFWLDPRLCFYISVSEETARARTSGRATAGDRFESKSLEFRRRVECGYRQMVAEQVLTHVDGEPPAEEVAQKVTATILSVVKPAKTER